MRRSYGWLVVSLFSVIFCVGCTSSSRLGADDTDNLESELTSSAEEAGSESDGVDMEEATDVASSELSDEVDSESGSDSLQAQEETSVEDDFSDELDEQNQESASQETATQEPPPPTDDQTAADESSASNSAPIPQTTGESVQITGLDFKANEHGGTIVIQGTGPMEYTTRTTANNQFVIEIQNAILPKKFKRPFDTKEFNGPVGSVNAYQNSGSSVARVVIQLRDSTQMGVTSEGNSLLVMPGGGAAGDSVAESSIDATDGTSSEDGGVQQEQPPEVSSSARTSKSLMGSRSLDEFLNGRIRFTGRPISIQFRDTDIREVFNFIAEESGLNLILSEEVAGKVSMKLRRIPWDQALVVIMQSKQLGYIRQGNILRISPISAIRRETDATRELIESQKLLQPLKVKIFSVSYAKAAELAGAVKDFLSPRGKVQTDARTNNVIVTDLEENLDKVGKVLRRLDSQTPEVLIEGKIVETRGTFNQVFGFNWNYNFQGYSVAVGLARDDATAFRASGTFGSLNAQLGLLEAENKVRVLSAPRVVALNNEKASIVQKTSIPIPQLIPSGTGVSTGYTYKDVSLSLSVVPQVSNDGSVIMQVEINREFLGASDSADVPPPVNSRQASTRILVRSGDTAVIGGVYQSDASHAETRIPFFHKIPVIGALFHNMAKLEDKTELVIFLTPRILNTAVVDSKSVAGNP